MQFSKQGLEDSEGNRTSKRRLEDDASCETEPLMGKIDSLQNFAEHDIVQQIIADSVVLDDVPVSSASSLEPVCHDDLGSNGRSIAALPAEEVLNKNGLTSVQKEIEVDSQASCMAFDGTSSKPVVSCLLIVGRLSDKHYDVFIFYVRLFRLISLFYSLLFMLQLNCFPLELNLLN